MESRMLQLLALMSCFHFAFAADFSGDPRSDTCGEAKGRKSHRGLLQRMPQKKRADESTNLAAYGADGEAKNRADGEAATENHQADLVDKIPSILHVTAAYDRGSAEAEKIKFGFTHAGNPNIPSDLQVLYYDDRSMEATVQCISAELEERGIRGALQAWHDIRPFAFKADLWRYMILWKFGGIYFDYEILLKAPLEDFVNRTIDSFVTVRGFAFDVVPRYYQAMLASAKGSAILEKAIAVSVANIKNREKGGFECLGVTGPAALYKAVQDGGFLGQVKAEYHFYGGTIYRVKGSKVLAEQNDQLHDNMIKSSGHAHFKDLCHQNKLYCDGPCTNATKKFDCQQALRVPPMAAVRVPPMATNAKIISIQKKLNTCLNKYASNLDTIASSLGDDVRARRLDVSAGAWSQSDKIFGAGFGTTATKSLDIALKTMGLKGEHYRPDLANILGGIQWPCNINKTACKAELAELFPRNWRYHQDYLMDTPVGELFADIFATYPQAKFIFTHRPPMEWVLSRLRHGQQELAPHFEPCGDKMGHHTNRELAQMFEYHTELVRCLVPRKNLFEINVWEDSKEKMTHLMEDLARFVGREVPDANYPMALALKFVPIHMGDSSKDCSFEEVLDNLSVTKLFTYNHVTDTYHIPSSYAGLIIQESVRRGCELELVSDEEPEQVRGQFLMDVSLD